MLTFRRGAGVGTSPGAFIAHGINTTIVEIDPVVLDYASKYFDLSPNHNAVVADAVSYMSDVANSTDERYDYIIHDVFTGGAEPVNLFTQEFMANLHAALKPDGVIAIVSLHICLATPGLTSRRTMLQTFCSQQPISSYAPFFQSFHPAAYLGNWNSLAKHSWKKRNKTGPIWCYSAAQTQQQL